MLTSAMSVLGKRTLLFIIRSWGFDLQSFHKCLKVSMEGPRQLSAGVRMVLLAFRLIFFFLFVSGQRQVCEPRVSQLLDTQQAT